jgi:hypothetical protein
MELEFEGSDGKLEAATGVELGSDGVELGGGDEVELGSGDGVELGAVTGVVLSGDGVELSSVFPCCVDWVCVSLLEIRSNGFLTFLLCRYANGPLGLTFRFYCWR